MAQFDEGLVWTVYGHGGFAEKSSLTFGDKDGKQLTSVIPSRWGFMAISVVTGGVLGNFEDFCDAVNAAETEALNPTNP